MSKLNRLFQSSVMRLVFMALLGLLFASTAHASTESYEVNPGGAMAAFFNTGAPGPNPGTYGDFTYTYRNAARALVHDVFWYNNGGVSNTGVLATDTALGGDGRELDISRNGGGRFTFQSLTLWNYTASTNIIFRGYQGGIQIYDSGDVWVQYILGSYTTYAPSTAWSDIDELRIVVKDNSFVFDPLIDNLIYTLGTPPTVTSNAASGTSATGATLNGTVNAHGDSTTVTFHYGTTVTYGSSISAAESPVTGTTDTAVSASLSGLSCNTAYHYRVSGTNIAATTHGADQSFTTAACLPGAPTIGTATAGNAQASVSFSAPASSGGTAITGYTVTSSPGSFTGTGTASPITVSGLTNGTAYTFTVTATNSVGTGAASAASDSVTPMGGQTITFANPGTQNFGTTPTLTASSDSGLAVSFTSGTTGVCTITTGGMLAFLATGPCTIHADQAGNGTYSAATRVSQGFTVAAVVPGAPTIGTATAGNTQASVGFSAPASNGGAAIAGYTVTSSPGGLTGTGTASPITVSGLTNGTAYTFTVTATNSVGTGSASAASNSVTPMGGQTITFGNPGTQNFGTAPTLTASSDSGLAVSFTSGTTGVCTITTGGALTFLATGPCTIHADQAGNGTYSAATRVSQGFTVAAVVPGAPTIGTATAGNTQASVGFSAPASNGGAAITGYTVTASPGGFTDTGAASPITVSGLTNGTAYTFTVTATNSAGTGAASAASNSVTPRAAQTIVVTNTNDSGAGSLRQTIADAISGDTVTFAGGVTGTIILTAPLSITKDLTITGPGAAVLAVSGNGAVRVLVIGSGVALNWSDLTVANGKYVTPSTGVLTAPGGGGLLNYGTLSLQNCAFNGNATVGEHPGYGVLGGAINNVLGTVTIHNCTFSGNSATHSVSAMAGMGGAIANLATMAVTNSTFANNTAQSNGGGLYSAGTLDVTNATIAGNSVTAASGTGGGIGIASGTTSLKNTLVANNTATASGPDVAGTVNSQGYNLFGSIAGATIGGDATGNLTNAAPLLGALANNGGPTQTLALLAGSPAIDAGTCTGAPATDQRGTARPQNGSCDIGAYEATLSFVSVTPSSSGNGSISPSTVQSLSHGATTSFTLTPNAGYHIGSVGGTCGGSLSGSTFTTAAVTADCTVVASFALNAYAVTVSAGVGGTASCTPNPVSHGGSSSCTASPGAGYSFNAWSGDCSGASCTLSNVTSTRSVSASFLANSATTYAITVSAGTGGTASCTPNPVSHGGTSTCTATPGAGYSFNAWSGDCSGASCTLSNVTGTRSVTASFLADSTKTYTAPSATGTGNITARFSGGGTQCSFNVRQFIPLTGHAASPPAGSAPKGVSFPHGLFDFTTVNCTPGSTITLVVTYPQTLPAGTVYWKYGPTPSDASYHWYQLPAVISSNIATFSITDGGLGDDDLVANGTVIDQGGPGAGGAVSIPTLSEWALLMLAGLMGLFGLGAMRRISA